LFQQRPRSVTEHHFDGAGVAVDANDDQIRAVVCRHRTG
jgi:hypothetical protein